MTKMGPAAAAPPAPTLASKKTTMKTKTTSSSSSSTSKPSIQKSKTKKTSTAVKKKIDLGKYKGITTEVRRFLAASKSLPPRFLQSQLRLILVPHANDPNFMKLLTKLWSIKMVKKISRQLFSILSSPFLHTFDTVLFICKYRLLFEIIIIRIIFFILGFIDDGRVEKISDDE